MEGEDVGGDIRLEGIGERCDELCLDAESVHDFESEYAIALPQIQAHCVVLVVDDGGGARFELTNVVGGRHGCLRVVERGGFWTGAAHPRRQKHREMPPPGASAPAFTATAEPTSTQITS